MASPSTAKATSMLANCRGATGPTSRRTRRLKSAALSTACARSPRRSSEFTSPRHQAPAQPSQRRVCSGLRSRGMRDLGYVEGRNLVIEYRDAEGNFDRLPALAAELVALKIDVIVAPN